MTRLSNAYINAKNVLIKRHRQYSYRYVLPVATLLMVGGYFIGNTLGDILILLGLVTSPLLFMVESIWLFIVYLLFGK